MPPAQAGATVRDVGTFEALIRAPRLGVGVSCENGGGGRGTGLDALRLREATDGAVSFLEIGTDVSRGLDAHVQAWVDEGLPTTYHFLDVNLEERFDADDAWIDATTALAREAGARWLCGDAGLWHLGPRERGHGLLLPPILTPESADELAESIRAIEARSGLCVLPENPPSTAYVGPLHLLEYFARVCEAADTGLLLDCAHLAIYQRVTGRQALDGLQDFPLERIVEIHVAGGAEREAHGFRWLEDDHSPEPLPETWAIVDLVLERAKNLKAVLYECEHNAQEEVLPNFRLLAERFPVTP